MSEQRHPIQAFDFDTEKLNQLILYVSQKCADHRRFGVVKLNKILYFSDFLTYARTGKPLTGAEYQRLQRGPSPRKMVSIMEGLKETNKLAIQPIPVIGYIEQRPVNLVEPNLELFSAAEIAIVDEIINKLQEMTGNEVSDLSHDWGGWKYAGEKETIPYESVFVSNEPLTSSEQKRGMEIAKQYTLHKG